MKKERNENFKDMTTPRYDGRESLLWIQEEHNLKKRHLGESRVDMTLCHLRREGRGEKTGKRVEQGS